MQVAAGRAEELEGVRLHQVRAGSAAGGHRGAAVRGRGGTESDHRDQRSRPAVPGRRRARRPGGGARAGRAAGHRRGRPAVGRRVEPADAGRAGTPGRIPSGGPHRLLPAVAPLPRTGPAGRLAGGAAGPVPEPGRSRRAGRGRPGRRRGGCGAGPGAAGRAGRRGGQPAVRHRDAGRAGAGGDDRDGRRTGRGGAAGPAAHAAADDPAPAELPVRRHAPGAAVRLDPGVQLHRHRPVGDDGPARGRAVRRAGRGDRRAGARGRRRPAPVPARRHPRRDLRGHAGHGRPQDGLTELEHVAGSPLLTGAERSGALGWASIARMWLGDLDGCAATAEEAGAAAAAAGTT
jgi:hypothetical protein